jgi:hypothetical protein
MGRMNSALTTALMGVIGIVIIEGFFSGIDTKGWNSALTMIVTTFLPIVFAACIILGLFRWFIRDEGPAQHYIRYKKWDSFGNRMKAAYAAKFGGDNPEFDKVVDQHVLAMKTQGKGYTKDIDEQWMKRMAKFVEVPFAVPEEERLSEDDKTREFEKYDPKQGNIPFV